MCQLYASESDRRATLNLVQASGLPLWRAQRALSCPPTLLVWTCPIHLMGCYSSSRPGIAFSRLCVCTFEIACLKTSTIINPKQYIELISNHKLYQSDDGAILQELPESKISAQGSMKREYVFYFIMRWSCTSCLFLSAESWENEVQRDSKIP